MVEKKRRPRGRDIEPRARGPNVNLTRRGFELLESLNKDRRYSWEKLELSPSLMSKMRKKLCESPTLQSLSFKAESLAKVCLITGVKPEAFVDNDKCLRTLREKIQEEFAKQGCAAPPASSSADQARPAVLIPLAIQIGSLEQQRGVDVEDAAQEASSHEPAGASTPCEPAAGEIEADPPPIGVSAVGARPLDETTQRADRDQTNGPPRIAAPSLDHLQERRRDLPAPREFPSGNTPRANVLWQGVDPFSAQLTCFQPWIIGPLALASALVMLVLPSTAAAVHWIPGSIDGGLLNTSWPFTSLILMPLILTLQAVAASQLTQQIETVGERFVNPPEGFQRDIADKLAMREGMIRFVGFGVTAVGVGADLLALIPRYFRPHRSYPVEAVDWKTAFLANGGPSIVSNALVVLLAYVWLGLVMYLALTWLIRICLAIQLTLGLMPPKPSQKAGVYHFNDAAVSDLRRRLGLWPLASSLNLIFVIFLAHGIYVVHHRVEVLRRATGWTWEEITTRCLYAVIDPHYLFDQRLYLPLRTANVIQIGISLLLAAWVAGVWWRVHTVRESLLNLPILNPQTYSQLVGIDPWPNGRRMGVLCSSWIVGLLAVALLPTLMTPVLVVLLIISLSALLRD